MKKHENKYHYMSKVTGEMCENIWEVIASVWWVLTHRFPVSVPITTYIKYMFLWHHSK